MKFLLLFIASVAFSNTFTDKFPELKQFLYKEPKSNFYFGLGVSPISILTNRILFTASIFQLHWIKKPFDIEIFNGSIGTSFGKSGYVGSNNFYFRISPKLNLLNFLSLGPFVGMEFVSFPSIKVKIEKNNLATPSYEPFSSNGLIYGLIFSETFDIGGGYFLKLNQLAYKQTYSTTLTSYGWNYQFEKEQIELDPERELIKPSVVFMLEVALLY